MSTWLMRHDAPREGAIDAIRLYRSHVLAAANYPRPDQHPWRSLLANLALEHREANERLALDAIRDWEAAGSPRLDTSIRTTQQVLLSCLRNQRDRQAASEALEPYQPQIERIVSHGT